jgi:hypothetical protein
MVSATHEHQGHHDNQGDPTADIAETAPGTSERGADENVDGDELGGWSDERLEDGLTTLAGQIAAATCRFLLLLAEYDRRRAWARWDCVSAEQWLSWRCQIDPRTAREHLRVAHRLTELPAVTEQFRAGRLSYSKVRAITRVATPDNVDDLLSLARYGTAAQLERAVAAYRRVGRFDDDATAAEQLRARRLDWRYEGDGSIVIRARLPADRGQLVLTAIRTILDDSDIEEEATRHETGSEPVAAPESHGAADVDDEVDDQDEVGHEDDEVEKGHLSLVPGGNGLVEREDHKKEDRDTN